MAWGVFILKALVGAGLFTLILWCAQSRQPRVAGMMLTFPALNGLGLLTGEGADPMGMASAMLPMIALNGVLCTAYMVAYPHVVQPTRRLSPCLTALVLLLLGSVLWGVLAWSVAPHVQRWLAASGQVALFLGVYACGGVWLTASSLWTPSAPVAQTRQRLRDVVQAHAVRILGMCCLLVLVMLLARRGAASWAGRLSALPLLPFYSLFMVSTTDSAEPRAQGRLAHMCSTVLIGPLIAMLFVWCFAQYIRACRLHASPSIRFSGGVLGLLLLWSLCGAAMWGIVRGLQWYERRCLGPAVSH